MNHFISGQGGPQLSDHATPASVLTGARLRARAGGGGGGGGGGEAVCGGHGRVRGGLRPEQQRGGRRPAGAALQLGRRAALARHARAGAPRRRAVTRCAGQAANVFELRLVRTWCMAHVLEAPRPPQSRPLAWR